MGPPRTRGVRPASRGRFHEGSMNDRASAIPPTHFLEPSEMAMLERPLPLNRQDKPGTQKQTAKKGTLLGHVWEGVRGRLRFRKDAEDDRSAAAAAARAKAKLEQEQAERPSREDVVASYHQLVASGFFSSHAIHSSRQPGPGQQNQQQQQERPGPASTPSHPRPSTSHTPKPPQWPLAPSRAPPPAPTPQQSSPYPHSPASASSRGTKRAAADDDSDAAREHESSTPRKLRKSASRDIALPKLRSMPSRLAARRSFSTAGTAPAGADSARSSIDAPPREPNKLTKRDRLLRVPGRASSVARRNVSEGFVRPVSTRVLRPRKSVEPLSVVPDTNRGIPTVPNIPAKFTYGEDRENGAPWRGLRR